MKKIALIAFMLAILQAALAQSFQILEKYCEGNYIIAKVNETGKIEYRILDYCPYGCKYGVCLSKREVPIVSIKEIYDVKACSDNVIFISVRNAGTKGDVSLSVTGEASKWIRYPEKISLDANETKTIAIVASIPCNVSNGIYPFTLVGSGATNFYAPSALSVGKSASLSITTTVSPIDVKFGLVLVVVIVIFFLAYRYSFRKMEEEKF
jgi:hypothetical protein